MRVLNNAKTLRTNQTEAEQRLWYHLRAHRFMGLKFKRQKPMGRYFVDFVCVERRLIIELDGGQHAEQMAYDQHRDAWLRSQGYTVCVSGTTKSCNSWRVYWSRYAALSPSPPTPLPRVGEGSKTVGYKMCRYPSCPQGEGNKTVSIYTTYALYRDRVDTAIVRTKQNTPLSR